MKRELPVLLVVDDNENNRYTLGRRLQREGYGELLFATNGREALAQLRAQPIDLVLLDIMMPELNGFEVLEHMRADERLRGVPVIMISALDELESVIRCIELGAEDHLPKPFNPVLLRARIGATLEKKRLRDQVAEQLAFVSEIFGKYVPGAVAEALIAKRGGLEPEQRTATVLYTDIEDFTRLAESMSPGDLIAMLNEYFDTLARAIAEHRGVINQFQGDAILATFNVPIEDSAHASNAVRAAACIQAACGARSFAGVRLRTRIGINTGEVVAGSVGASDRLNYTVHGDAVNLAARLEQLNKQFGTCVLVAASTAEQAAGQFRFDGLGPITVRGRREPVEVFALSLGVAEAEQT